MQNHDERQASRHDLEISCSQFAELISSVSSSENEVQAFLETHSELIPTPWLLNHALHLEIVISKFPLGTGLVTDFAYLTKSSVAWDFCVVEIEDPHKRIFTSDQKRVVFSADFTRAQGQVDSWKSFLEGVGAEQIKEQLHPLMKRMPRNRLKFKYALVYGRGGEMANNQERIDRFNQLNTVDFKVLTYDSLINAVRHAGGIRKNILIARLQGFELKHLNQIDTTMFAYLYPNELFISPVQESQLVQDGFQMGEWRQGKLLTDDQRFSSDQRKEAFAAFKKRLDIKRGRLPK